MTSGPHEHAERLLGWMCPDCYHGSDFPFRCGGPHSRKGKRHPVYDFVDAVPVAALAELGQAREAAKTARAIAAAPDYDEEAIRDALWAVVDAALAGSAASNKETE